MSDSAVTSPLTNIGNTIQMTGSLTALIVGMVGNVLIILVMARPSMRTNSASFYFTVLALSDIGVLLSVVPSDLMGWNRFGTGNSYSIYTCILPIYFRRVCGGTSLWLLVALEVDRFIAVKTPLKAKQLCTVRRAVVVSAFIFILHLLKCSQVLWLRGEETVTGSNNTSAIINCGYVSGNARNYLTFINPILGLIFETILPLGASTTLNIVIIHELRKKRRFVWRSLHCRNYKFYMVIIVIIRL